MKKFILHLFVLPFFVSFSNSDTKNIISNTVADKNEVEVITLKKNGREKPTLEEMLRPITFTPSGLRCYFKHIYNSPDYAQLVLPTYPFKHLEEFIQHGNANDQPHTYTKAVFRLFDKKIKSSPYVNADKFVEFLKILPNLVEKNLAIHFQTITTRKNALKSFVQHELSTNFEKLQNDPDTFVSNLADHLLGEKKQALENTIKEELGAFFAHPGDVEKFLNDLAHKIYDTIENEELAIIELQYAITALIETSLNKVYWTLSNDEIWESFLNIGKELTSLHKKNIIRDVDTLDVCQWTLTTRFCLFLSASGSDVPLTTYMKAQKDLIHGISHLDGIEEQEDLIMKKTEQLQHAVIQGKAKSDARQAGIVSDFILNE